MKLEDMQQAIFAFGNVVSIDEKQSDAWANIANCYSVQDKFKEALACTEQALKINRRSWKIWHNMIRFCIATNKFYKATHAIRTLMYMGKLEGLNNTLLLKLTEVWLENYCNNP